MYQPLPTLSRITRPLSLLLLAALAVAAGLLPASPAGAEHDGPYTGGDDPYYGDGYDDGDGTYDDGAPAEYDSGYSYVRTLRGDATLIQADGEREELATNQPVLVGDRVWVSPGSMAEVLLSDGNLLRIDGDSEVSFDALAGSPEARDAATALRLLEGNLQLVVFTDSVGDELPRVDLPNATFYAASAGRYRLTSDRGDWSQVVARRGLGHVVTRDGEREVRAGTEVLVEGAYDARIVGRQAGGFDPLERWGDELDRRVDDSGYVDDSLRYAAAPLEDHGSWVSVDSGRAWRPRVAAEWSPYTDGRWRHTSIGLTWVSYEPWGWVPYHYGTWDHVPAYGWVWFPGRTFSPARVHWYWGPSHVAWVPSGYYSRHYRHRTRWGVYGWAGGSWDPFDRWVFCSTRYFGHRHQGRFAHDGRYWKRHHRGVLPRGIVTTDTRRLTRDRWHDPQEAIHALRTRPGRNGVTGVRTVAELPDVTPFVERRDRDRLPREVRQRVLRTDAGGARRVVGADAGGRPGRSVQVDGDAGVRPRSSIRRPRIDGGDTRSGDGIGAGADDVRDGDGGPVIRRTPPRGADAPRVTTRGVTPRRDAAGRDDGGEADRGARRVTGPGSRVDTDRPAAQRPSAGAGTARPRAQVRPRAERDEDGGRAGVDRSPRSHAAAPGPRVDSPRATTPTRARVQSPRATPPQARRPQRVPSRAPAGQPRATSPGEVRRGDAPHAGAPTVRRRPSAPASSTQRPAQGPSAPRPSAQGAASPRRQAAPRRDRAGADRRTPAQRVLQGVRSTPQSRPPATRRGGTPSQQRGAAARAPQRRAPSASSSSRAPQRRAPSASSRPAPRRPAASSRSGGGSSRSSAGARSGGSSRSSGKSTARRAPSSSSGGKGKAVQRRGRSRDDGR